MSRLSVAVRSLRWAIAVVLVLIAAGTAIGLRADAADRREAEVVRTADRYVDALMTGDEAAAASVLCPGVTGLQLTEELTGYVETGARVDGESAAVTYRLGPFHRDGRWQTYRQLDLWLGETDVGWCIASTPELRAA
jgi:hypothetical protein